MIPIPIKIHSIEHHVLHHITDLEEPLSSNLLEAINFYTPAKGKRWSLTEVELGLENLRTQLFVSRTTAPFLDGMANFTKWYITPDGEKLRKELLDTVKSLTVAGKRTREHFMLSTLDKDFTALASPRPGSQDAYAIHSKYKTIPRGQQDDNL